MKAKKNIYFQINQIKTRRLYFNLIKILTLYKMEQRKTKNTTSCKIHNKPIKYFCQDSLCERTRLLCKLCKQKQHKQHSCRQLSCLNNITKNLDQMISQSTNRGQKFTKKLSQLLQKFDHNSIQLGQLIHTSKISIPLKIAPKFSFLNLIMEGKLGTYLQQNQQLKQRQFNQIISLIEFIQNKNINSIQEINEIVEIVVQKLGKSFDNWKNNIQNAFSFLYYQLEKCEIKNWLDLYREKHQVNCRQNYIKQNMRNTQNQYKKDKIQNSAIQKMSQDIQHQSSKIQLQLKNHFDKILQQIFQQKSSSHQQHKINQQLFQPIQSIQQIPQLGQKQLQIRPLQNQYNRFVLKKQNMANTITKLDIDNQLNKLIESQNYINKLKQFIIEGSNQFDLQCLKKLVHHFPQLTKFNYLWDFDKNGLQLQKIQVFFQKPIIFNKEAKDLKISQELLDTYGQIQNLQNITINHINLFTYQQMFIRNKNIKHLTIGQYLQGWQDQVIPKCLINYALSLNNLISLNIYNIKIIKGDFMQKILYKFQHSLKNIWLSQCIILQESFMLALKDSKIQRIILDQIKKIIHTIYIPKTLKVLIIDNCSFQNEIPFIGLRNATNLTDFSIFESLFPQAIIVEDKLIEELSSMSPACNLEYLNIAQCKTVTNSSIKFLQKMPKLKQLCIDNTKICLQKLSKSDLILNRLKKLGIVGLSINATSTSQIQKYQKPLICICLQQILTKSYKLKLISLKFQQDFTQLDMNSFNNIDHVSISSTRNKKSYKQKSLRTFIKRLKKMNKSINNV